MFKANSAIASAAILAVALTSAAGQPMDQPRREAVRPTAFERPGNLNRADAVTFGRRAPRIGDCIEQTLSLEMQLNTSMRQGNQLLEKTRTTMRNHQRRLVTTLSVDQGRSDAVKVRYLEATKQLEAGDAVEEVAESPGVPQPVSGKTYLCRREGGDDGKLVITDAAGHIPPANEHEIVAQNMEMVGRSNPLAEFLAGRTMSVGETVSLPKNIAGRLFNLGKRYGEVTRFDLTLQKTRADGNVQCAEFLARVEAASNDSSQMRLEVEGPLVVELATCRVVHTEF